MKRGFKFLSFIVTIALLFSALTAGAKQDLPVTFNLKATGGCGYNFLEWEKVDGADRYWIYRGIGEGNEESMPLTDFPVEETYYKDAKNIVLGTKYCYYVRAVNKDAKEFAQSNEACAIPTCSSGRIECKLILRYQVGNKKYWVNETQKGPMEAAPVIRWDRTFLLIRYVVQEVGGEISWDATTRTVIIITKEGKKIEFQIGNNKYKVNGVEKPIDPYNPSVIPFIEGNRTLIPLRVTGNELNAKEINWYGDEKIAELIFEYLDNCNCNCPCQEYEPYSNNYCFKSGCTVEYLKSDGTWSPISTVPCSIADSDPTGWRWNIGLPPTPTPHAGTSSDPYSPWENIYKDGGCWIYAGRWKGVSSPATNVSVLTNTYRQIIKLDYKCTNLTFEIFVDDEVDVYIDSMDTTGFIGHATGYTTATILNRNGVTAGNHTIYFKHINTKPNYYGLIYGIKCSPCEGEKKGGIIVKVHCPTPVAFVPIPGVGINIFKVSDSSLAWNGHTNEDGIADTCFNLEPGDYKVVPYGYDNYCDKIYPESQLVTVIPGEKTKVEFKCCREETKKICACLVRMTIQPDANGNYQVYIKENCEPGDPVYTHVLNFPATLLDGNLGINILDYYNQFDHPVPAGLGCLTVVYNISNNNAIEWWAFPDRKPCCGGEQGGRIIVSMSKECLSGTTVYIYDTSGNEVWHGTANNDGLFDTGCKLKCPATYKVVPKNEKCKFSPESAEVRVPCCPDVAKVEFKCECGEKKGRIDAILPENCIKGTVIEIYDANGKLITTIKESANNVFTTGCTLPCPGTYIVKPINQNCKFSPESQKAEIKNCCPDYVKVYFKCECRGQGNGKFRLFFRGISSYLSKLLNLFS